MCSVGKLKIKRLCKDIVYTLGLFFEKQFVFLEKENLSRDWPYRAKHNRRLSRVYSVSQERISITISPYSTFKGRREAASM